MAYAKITDLGPATTPLAGTELLEIVQSGNAAGAIAPAAPSVIMCAERIA